MMRFIAMVLVLISVNAFAINKTEQLNSFIKIWGVVKYMHPEASRGAYDMNKEFVEKYDQITKGINQQEFEQNILSWIEHFDSKRNHYSTTQNQHTEIYADYHWISNFGSPLQNKLRAILNNDNTGDYYAKLKKMTSYVILEDESKTFAFNQDIRSHQLLLLASFWNAMQFWNVNITLNDKTWNLVLEETVKKFESSKTTTDFERIKDNLLADINDSHSDNLDISLVLNRMKYYPVFGGKIINDSLVITEIRDLPKAQVQGVALGDVVVGIDDMTVAAYISKNFHLCSSNGSSIRARIQRILLLASDKRTIKISLLKRESGLVVNKEIPLYEPSEIDYAQASSMPSSFLSSTYTSVNDEIGYINLQSITGKTLKKALTAFKDSKGIIVDLRTHPANLLIRDIDHLVSDEKRFLKILAPVGPAKRAFQDDNIVEKIAGSAVVVYGKKKSFKGIVVLLVDRGTQSKAEYLGAAIQQNDKCYTIGEQTSGAIMNTNHYQLLNGQTFVFTNYMAMDVSGNYVLQRNGLKLDKELQENTKHYKPSLYIDEAIKYINSVAVE